MKHYFLNALIATPLFITLLVSSGKTATAGAQTTLFPSQPASRVACPAPLDGYFVIYQNGCPVSVQINVRGVNILAYLSPSGTKPLYVNQTSAPDYTFNIVGFAEKSSN